MQIMNKEHQIIIFQDILANNSAKIPVLLPKMAIWAQGILAVPWDQSSVLVNNQKLVTKQIVFMLKILS